MDLHAMSADTAARLGGAGLDAATVADIIVRTLQIGRAHV